MTRTPSSGTPGVTREFVGLASPTARRAGSGGHPCQGLYHRGVGRKPKVAMIAVHYQIDFSEHYLADYMATRGIGFLGWNTRFRGFESSFMLDHALVDIGVGVRWLREVQGVETIVLLGNSGGGSLMAAYQAQAVDPHVTPLEGMRPAAGLTELPAADGYVASAAHPGRPDVLTAWMDASVIDENDPIATDSESGSVRPEERSALQRGLHHPLPVGTGGPQQRDHRLGRTRTQTCSRRRLLRPPVHRPAHLGRSPNGRPHAGAEQATSRTCATSASRSRPTGRRTASPRRRTLRSWLGMWSLRHAQTRAEPHLARIDCPALVINAEQDTGVYPSDAQRIYDALASNDKTQCAIDTDHYFTTPGARSEKADTIARWIAKRWR